MSESDFSRRGFVRLCTTAVALAAASPAIFAQLGNAPSRRYERVKLVDDRERPIAVKTLKVGETYLFYYPYVTTPCFLINLGKPAKETTLQTEDGRQYRSGSGLGPQHSIVAFSAICAHKMSHPAKEVSFINYRHQPATFQDAGEQTAQRAQVIYCCSEKSVYDPLEGAKVLGGPAKQPLTTILLEQDGGGSLYATGTVGGEMYDKFFERFSSRLSLEFRTTDVRKLATNATTVMPLTAYCRNQVMC